MGFTFMAETETGNKIISENKNMENMKKKAVNFLVQTVKQI